MSLKGKAIACIDYEPPKSYFDDTMLAFQAIAPGGRMRLTIENDPLGPVNKIITLWRNDFRIKKMLYPVNEGSAIQIGHDPGTGWHSGPGWREFYGEPVPEWSRHGPIWYVEVNGRRIIEVPEYLTHPPIPQPPRPPWHRRVRIGVRTAIRRRSRALTDRLATRLGYVHKDSIGDDW